MYFYTQNPRHRHQSWEADLGLSGDQVQEMIRWSQLSRNVRVKGWARNPLEEGAEVLYRDNVDADTSKGEDVAVAVQSKRGFKFRVWTAGSWRRAEVEHWIGCIIN